MERLKKSPHSKDAIPRLEMDAARDPNVWSSSLGKGIFLPFFKNDRLVTMVEPFLACLLMFGNPQNTYGYPPTWSTFGCSLYTWYPSFCDLPHSIPHKNVPIGFTNILHINPGRYWKNNLARLAQNILDLIR